MQVCGLRDPALIETLKSNEEEFLTLLQDA